MDTKTHGLFLVLTSVLLLALVQLVVKSRLNMHGHIPVSLGELPRYVLALLGDVRFMTAMIALLVAAFSWYAGVSRLPLSLALPFAALSYPLIFMGTIVFLGEAFSWAGFMGNILIVCGVALAASAIH
jgi:drug/metabolite transporter (DMT)-like permease